MPTAKTAQFSRPLRNVRLVRAASPVSYTAEEWEAARKESYQRGCADTSAMMEQHLVEQREEILHLQDKTFAAVIDCNNNLVTQLRNALPELTLEAVRRVLAQTEIDRELVLRLVEELLSEISEGRQTVEVTLSAPDLALIEGVDTRFREKFPELEFRADADLQPGDCIARSRHGAIDGRLATKLKTLERAFQ
ncbi:MAG TPA: FliH/SctL family protein [Chthoniobacterales bacterium]|nr:FliH/SctL family protein [Chthoniobacterales bacterium]